MLVEQLASTAAGGAIHTCHTAAMPALLPCHMFAYSPYAWHASPALLPAFICTFAGSNFWSDSCAYVSSNLPCCELQGWSGRRSHVHLQSTLCCETFTWGIRCCQGCCADKFFQVAVAANNCCKADSLQPKRNSNDGIVLATRLPSVQPSFDYCGKFARY